MSIDQTPYSLAFSECLGIGPVTFKKLLEHYGDSKTAYEAPLKELEALIGPRTARTFDEFRRENDPNRTIDELLKKDIQFLTLDNPLYPKLLAQITDPPICLYIKGDKTIFSTFEDRFFAIVGTRNVTSYGTYVAAQFATGLSSAGFCIVSGMALGVDTVAHQSTLKADGKTVAVLGCGVDIIYPPSNRALYQEIIESGGAVISEFPPGKTVLPGFFVSRNRIVSGMSRGILVVEGSSRSGTLITARYAAEQGRDVFAPPSPITSAFSQAPNILIKQGAKMVTSVDDIIEEYHMTKPGKSTVESDFSNLSGTLRTIAESLVSEPSSADELREKLQLPISEILQTVSLLEINGLVAKNDESRYYIK